MALDQVILGIVVGAAAGLAFSYLMKFTHRRGYIDRESYVAQYLAMAIFITGLVNFLGSDDLLAAFAAGSPSISKQHGDTTDTNA